MEEVWLNGYSGAMRAWRNWLKEPGGYLAELHEAAAQDPPAVTESTATAPGGYREAEIVHAAKGPIPEPDEPPEIPRETFARGDSASMVEDRDSTTEAGAEFSAAPNERSSAPATKPLGSRKLAREESMMLYSGALANMEQAGGPA